MHHHLSVGLGLDAGYALHLLIVHQLHPRNETRLEHGLDVVRVDMAHSQVHVMEGDSLEGDGCKC